jgi:hypothetical protein
MVLEANRHGRSHLFDSVGRQGAEARVLFCDHDSIRPSELGDELAIG